MHACVFCTSLVTGTVWLFPATHTHVATLCVFQPRKQMWHPHPMMQSSPAHSVELLCWVLEAEVLPSLLARMLKISPVLPNACACEIQKVVGVFLPDRLESVALHHARLVFITRQIEPYFSGGTVLWPWLSSLSKSCKFMKAQWGGLGVLNLLDGKNFCSSLLTGEHQ